MMIFNTVNFIFPRWKQAETAVVCFKYPLVNLPVELLLPIKNGCEAVPKQVKIPAPLQLVRVMP